TRRTARSRTSGENFVTFLFMAPFSQELEPPQNPGRFTLWVVLYRFPTAVQWVAMPCYAPLKRIYYGQNDEEPAN
ncbi:hypothetical protein, partial [Paraburkholderia sabiae]|uniref:hypothetical protein n=1 Tax=Paraburkholderia sabiae TaxID=273251 RepID=UPI001F28399E